MQLIGNWYAKGSSTKHQAILSTKESSYQIEVENETLYQGALESLSIEGRLGNIERKITLEDGSIFVTNDNNGVDMLLPHISTRDKLLHHLESNMRWVIIAVLVTIFTVFAFFTWGLPYASNKIAHALPHSANKVISTHTMKLLDKYLFEDSNISTKKMEEIRTNFHTKILPNINNDIGYDYKLHFRLMREGNFSIPNALALPSGDIVLTDKFVQLCQNQDEMDSVILHEVGHVAHRHSLEMLIKSTIVTVSIMMVLGDSNGLADMGVGLGSMMLSMKYSREHEGQADTYAFNNMLRNNIDPIAFANIMQRIDVYIQRGKEDESLEYISSHPKTKDRIDRAKLYSQCFKQGLTNCRPK